MRPVVFVDLETGGLNWWPHTMNGQEISMNPITQLAAVVVDLDDQCKVLEEMNMMIKFDPAHCTQTALELNHYDPVLWEQGYPEYDAIQRFRDLLSRWAYYPEISKKGNTYYVAMMGGHNIAGFDKSFIFAWFKKFNLFCPADYHVIDTMAIAQVYGELTGTKIDSFKLTELATLLGVEEVKAHDALEDIRMTVGVYQRMLEKLKFGYQVTS